MVILTFSELMTLITLSHTIQLTRAVIVAATVHVTLYTCPAELTLTDKVGWSATRPVHALIVTRLITRYLTISLIPVNDEKSDRNDV